MSKQNDPILNRLESKLGKGRVKSDFNLAPYLTLRTKTKAAYYFEAESRDDLINAKKVTLEQFTPLFVLGGGSNLAVLSDKIQGLTVRNKYLSKSIKRTSNGALLTVSSGYSITKLAKELADMGYSGLEYHLGLPGTIGGALYMNSKWTNPLSYMGDTLISANLIDTEGNEKKVDRSYFRFAYDTSTLQKTKEIVLEAVFSLTKTDPVVTKERSQLSLKYRKESQPFGVFTSGCFFRNVNGQSAGMLVDQAGLKGTRIGKFHVSEKHANFIINDGDGDPDDLKKLLQLIKQKVNEKFNVKLVEEAIVM